MATQKDKDNGDTPKKGRELVHWTPPKDQLVLTKFVECSNETGAKIPWDMIAGKVSDILNKEVTGGALAQHCAKLRRQLDASTFSSSESDSSKKTSAKRPRARKSAHNFEDSDDDDPSDTYRKPTKKATKAAARRQKKLAVRRSKRNVQEPSDEQDLNPDVTEEDTNPEPLVKKEEDDEQYATFHTPAHEYGFDAGTPSTTSAIAGSFDHESSAYGFDASPMSETFGGVADDPFIFDTPSTHVNVPDSEFVTTFRQLAQSGFPPNGLTDQEFYQQIFGPGSAPWEGVSNESAIAQYNASVASGAVNGPPLNMQDLAVESQRMLHQAQQSNVAQPQLQTPIFFNQQSNVEQPQLQSPISFNQQSSVEQPQLQSPTSFNQLQSVTNHNASPWADGMNQLDSQDDHGPLPFEGASNLPGYSFDLDGGSYEQNAAASQGAAMAVDTSSPAHSIPSLPQRDILDDVHHDIELHMEEGFSTPPRVNDEDLFNLIDFDAPYGFDGCAEDEPGSGRNVQGGQASSVYQIHEPMAIDGASQADVAEDVEESDDEDDEESDELESDYELSDEEQSEGPDGRYEEDPAPVRNVQGGQASSVYQIHEPMAIDVETPADIAVDSDAEMADDELTDEEGDWETLPDEPTHDSEPPVDEQMHPTEETGDFETLPVNNQVSIAEQASGIEQLVAGEQTAAMGDVEETGAMEVPIGNSQASIAEHANGVEQFNTSERTDPVEATGVGESTDTQTHSAEAGGTEPVGEAGLATDTEQTSAVDEHDAEPRHDFVATAVRVTIARGGSASLCDIQHARVGNSQEEGAQQNDNATASQVAPHQQNETVEPEWANHEGASRLPSDPQQTEQANESQHTGGSASSGDNARHGVNEYAGRQPYAADWDMFGRTQLLDLTPAQRFVWHRELNSMDPSDDGSGPGPTEYASSESSSDEDDADNDEGGDARARLNLARRLALDQHFGVNTLGEFGAERVVPGAAAGNRQGHGCGQVEEVERSISSSSEASDYADSPTLGPARPHGPKPEPQVPSYQFQATTLLGKLEELTPFFAEVDGKRDAVAGPSTACSGADKENFSRSGPSQPSQQELSSSTLPPTQQDHGGAPPYTTLAVIFTYWRVMQAEAEAKKAAVAEASKSESGE